MKVMPSRASRRHQMEVAKERARRLLVLLGLSPTPARLGLHAGEPAHCQRKHEKNGEGEHQQSSLDHMSSVTPHLWRL